MVSNLGSGTVAPASDGSARLGTASTVHVIRYWGQPKIWSDELNELDRVRIPKTISMIPPDVEGICEIWLRQRPPHQSDRRSVSGHRSGHQPNGLEVVTANRVVGSSDRVPIRSGSVDLVICADPYWGAGGHEVCPACGHAPCLLPPTRNLLQRALSRLCHLANEFLDSIVPSGLRPKHEIIRLYTRPAYQ